MRTPSAASPRRWPSLRRREACSRATPGRSRRGRRPPAGRRGRRRPDFPASGCWPGAHAPRRPRSRCPPRRGRGLEARLGDARVADRDVRGAAADPDGRLGPVRDVQSVQDEMVRSGAFDRDAGRRRFAELEGQARHVPVRAPQRQSGGARARRHFRLLVEDHLDRPLLESVAAGRVERAAGRRTSRVRPAAGLRARERTGRGEIVPGTGLAAVAVVLCPRRRRRCGVEPDAGRRTGRRAERFSVQEHRLRRRETDGRRAGRRGFRLRRQRQRQNAGEKPGAAQRPRARVGCRRVRWEPR